jgi:two-component system sensor histidine kinase VicK
MCNKPPLEPSSPRSSPPNTDSSAIERTVVLSNPEQMVETTLRIYTQMSKCMDTVCDDKGVQVTINIKSIWEAILVLKRKGVKLRWITNITGENLDWCKKFMIISEMRHLDRIEGAFGILDGKYYLASANVTKEGKTFPGELIVSNVKVIVQQQQQIFSLLWDKAIPAKQRIKEIEQGFIREFIDIIRDPIDIKKLIFDLIRRAYDEISILFSSANAFRRLEQEGILEVIKQASSERNVNVRILVDVSKDDDLKEIKKQVKWAEQGRSITFQPILKSSFKTKITTLMVDSTLSLTVEMKDKSKESFENSVGLATYSNSESTIDTYTSIFETLWIQNTKDCTEEY